MLHLGENIESRKILTLLSRSLPYYLASWRDLDETTGLFGSLDPQPFNMRSIGTSSPVIEYVVRPHAHVLCMLSAFLRTPECRESLEPHVTTERASELVNKGLRWMCQTHLSGSRTVDSFLARRQWGENWRSSLWASMAGFCLYAAADILEDDVVESIRAVVAHEANRFISILPPSGCEFDTKLEENAQDTMILAWACNLLPNHEKAADWRRSLDIWGLNIASCMHDKADHSAYQKRSIAHLVRTQNLYPDMTSENHGFFHPDILTYSGWVVMAMAAFAVHGNPVPPVLRRKSHEETFDILLPFCLPNGLLFAPGGQDLPMFVPRPFSLAWGLWNNDPRALRLTERLLSWIDTHSSNASDGEGPWVFGFPSSHEGWVLFFQSLVGFELALLASLPFPKQIRFYSTGQIENAVDTRRIFPYVEICFRRNTQSTRCIAWKTLEKHPLVSVNIHNCPELVAPFKAAMLGIPALTRPVKSWHVAHHADRFQKDGFDSFGLIRYFDANGTHVLSRSVRALTWGDEGLMVLDEIVAETDVELEEQYLSPIYLVNDRWTGGTLELRSGSLLEDFPANQPHVRGISCPAFWASVEHHLLVQFMWGREKGMVYVPGGERNAPPYWNNCRLDMLAVHVEPRTAIARDVVYRAGFFVGAGKAPRPFKCTGTAGEFFKGLVIMDGKNTLGLD